MFFVVHRTDIDSVEFWGVLACHLTLAILVGLTFRHHEQLAAAWEFTGVATFWWLLAIGCDVIHFFAAKQLILSWDIGLLSRRIAVYGSLTASPATAALFAWAFIRHRGKRALLRLVATLAFSGFATFMINGYAFGDRYIDGDDLFSELYWLGGANWSVAVGWIIWYVGMFGTQAAATSVKCPP